MVILGSIRGGKKHRKEEKQLGVVLVIGTRCQKVPRRVEGLSIAFYLPLQRSRPLSHLHSGMFHAKVDIAQRTEYLVVNIEALPHPPIFAPKLGIF